MGIELGSTRIKAVIIDSQRKVISSGSHHWESRIIDGHYSYPLADVKNGLRDAVSRLKTENMTIRHVGISAMMHGYLVFDQEDRQLAAFRTWKDTSTTEAADKLTRLFDFNIPERWSVAHLYQAILNGETHVQDITFITTLAGYVHWQLTGEKVIGIGDASGMFPVKDNAWHPEFVEKFRELTGIDWLSIAPKILVAGEAAGYFSDSGKEYLFDHSEQAAFLSDKCVCCPPEGDAGTGMVACKAIAPNTGNVSAGTSIFAMVVLDKPLSRLYREVDIVTTPDGRDVAMVHYNECTSKIDPWMERFEDAFSLFGFRVEKFELYDKLYEVALKREGKIAVFMRDVLESAVADLAGGLRILKNEEKVRIDKLAGHGGFFKSGEAGRVVMSEMTGIPIEISETAAEGGAWGIALLADYVNVADKMTLNEYLEEK